MVYTMEGAKSGDRVRVGAKGKVSALMMCELDAINHKSQASVSCRKKLQTGPVSVSCGVPTKKQQQPRRVSSSASTSTVSSSKSNANNHGISGTIQINRYSSRQNSHQIPMLGSEDVGVDRTPIRGKSEKRVSQIVEVVDVKCGDSDRAWTNPISNRFRGLSFSRLS